MMTFDEAQRLSAMAHKQKQGGDVMGTLTLRDYFAAKAMQGLIAQSAGTALGSRVEIAAEYAYAAADAMLKARQQ